MIDPSQITNYNLTKEQLEEVILFWVLAAGKNGTRAALCLDNILNSVKVNNMSPFCSLQGLNKEGISNLLKEHKTGCHNNKGRSVYEVVNSDLDLFSCSAEELEKIYGIGMKTSRCFIIHSRKSARYAGLDTHVLKFLKTKGIQDVPKSTPTSRKLYLRLEAEFLKLSDESGKSVADLDLEVWNKYKV